MTWGFSTGRIVALSQGHNRKRSNHHQWWPWTRKFHHRRRDDKVQCRRWRVAASGQLSGSWAQNWLRHGAFPILPSEPVGMSHNKIPPPQQCLEWSDVDPDRRALEVVQQFQELCSFWVSLCVCHCQMMCDLSWTGHTINNTSAQLKLWSPKACWIVRVSAALVPRLVQNFIHTRCSFLWSIMKIATGHVHDSKQRHVKTAHVDQAMCNLAKWLTRHGSPTVYRCFALPQLLYRWQHQSGRFWIPPCILLRSICFLINLFLYFFFEKWYNVECDSKWSDISVKRSHRKMSTEVSLFKILVHFYQFRWNHIPDNSNLHGWSLPQEPQRHLFCFI